MRSEQFWTWFNAAAARLALREISFRKIFEHLDALDAPITIVETGCVRTVDNWEGDGQSTILFDRYVRHGGQGSIVHSVDLDAQATAICRTQVSDRVTVHTADSVALLRHLAAQLRKENRRLDLLYLDSYDLNWHDPTPSAVHVLKEFLSIGPAVNGNTLVVVDDCALQVIAVADAANGLRQLAQPKVGGKGKYLAEYATQIQARIRFLHYQAGWTGMGPL